LKGIFSGASHFGKSLKTENEKASKTVKKMRKKNDTPRPKAPKNTLTANCNQMYHNNGKVER
jgi:hypothetical protein